MKLPFINRSIFEPYKYIYFLILYLYTYIFIYIKYESGRPTKMCLFIVNQIKIVKFEFV